MYLLEEVDNILRSMENQKASRDENEKTRDALARIDGLERDPVSLSPMQSDAKGIHTDVGNPRSGFVASSALEAVCQGTSRARRRVQGTNNVETPS